VTRPNWLHRPSLLHPLHSDVACDSPAAEFPGIVLLLLLVLLLVLPLCRLSSDSDSLELGLSCAEAAPGNSPAEPWRPAPSPSRRLRAGSPVAAARRVRLRCGEAAHPTWAICRRSGGPSAALAPATHGCSTAPEAGRLSRRRPCEPFSRILLRKQFASSKALRNSSSPQSLSNIAILVSTASRGSAVSRRARRAGRLPGELLRHAGRALRDEAEDDVDARGRRAASFSARPPERPGLPRRRLRGAPSWPWAATA